MKKGPGTVIPGPSSRQEALAVPALVLAATLLAALMLAALVLALTLLPHAGLAVLILLLRLVVVQLDRLARLFVVLSAAAHPLLLAGLLLLARLRLLLLLAIEILVRTHR